MSRQARTPIVVFGDDWGRSVSTLQHLVRELVVERPVLWVNGIGHRGPRLSRSDLSRFLRKAMAMMHTSEGSTGSGAIAGPRPDLIVQPRVLPWHHRRAIYAWNVRAIVKAVHAGLAALGGSRAPIVLTGSPPSVGALGLLREVASVYFCMDDFLHLPSATASMIAPLERELLSKVDAVVATAEHLTLAKKPRTGRVHYLPQGVSYEHFARPREEPKDLARLPHPRIGFAGGVSDCVSFSLVRRLADEFPDGSVVLVGPVTTATGRVAARNVHLLDWRPYSELPAYVQHFDVGIIPYLRNQWTMSVDPLKLLEYCAAGVPVVSTDIPEAYKYREAVTIAADEEAFVRDVRGALAADRSAVRLKGQSLAGRNTWKVRAAELLAILDDVEERARERVA